MDFIQRVEEGSLTTSSNRLLTQTYIVKLQRVESIIPHRTYNKVCESVWGWKLEFKSCSCRYYTYKPTNYFYFKF